MGRVFGPCWHPSKELRPVAPCDTAFGYRPTCWRQWTDGPMVARACEEGPGILPGVLDEDVPVPSGPSKREVIPPPIPTPADSASGSLDSDGPPDVEPSASAAARQPDARSIAAAPRAKQTIHDLADAAGGLLTATPPQPAIVSTAVSTDATARVIVRINWVE